MHLLLLHRKVKSVSVIVHAFSGSKRCTEKGEAGLENESDPPEVEV